MKITIAVKYKPGEKVYYNLPDCQAGIVIDWKYQHTSGRVQYLVSFTADYKPKWCYECELVDQIVYNN